MQENGKQWYDVQGNTIQAHGGWIIFAEGYYWWYGENRRGNRYVSCYRSADLETWEFRRDVLTTESRTEAIRHRTDLSLMNAGRKVNIERPKVLFCRQTGKYVMWAHYENGENYLDARCCIATCDTPDGDFVYHGSFNPYGYMSRDCTLFQDDDGKAYFLSAARDNADLHVYLLSEDLLNVKKHVNTLWQGEYREAPAVFKRNGKYYILSSYCTGWMPNQGKWAVGSSMEEPFSELAGFGNETTFDSQPAFVLSLDEDGCQRYVYWADRWCYEGTELIVQEEVGNSMDVYSRSTYIVLPIQFGEKEEPFIEWTPRFRMRDA